MLSGRRSVLSAGRLILMYSECQCQSHWIYSYRVVMRIVSIDNFIFCVTSTVHSSSDCWRPTERSLLPVRRSGTVCHTTLLTVYHWRHSARNWKLLCFLHHFHDYIFLFSGPWGFYLGHFKISYVCTYVCMKQISSKLRQIFRQHQTYDKCHVASCDRWICSVVCLSVTWLH